MIAIVDEIIINNDFFLPREIEKEVNRVSVESESTHMQELVQELHQKTGDPAYSFSVDEFNHNVQNKLKKMYLKTKSGKEDPDRFNEKMLITITPMSERNDNSGKNIDVIFN
ncbi:hypothetical protein [Secundilactobacillus folii]|uniref:Uncharacterized protein n=1 Tax=Secundilactobacillus folii TaxID=2678357 RepID=A0A7X2XVY7_9LACO|nr:hypothetical protein [Secundilactobacillus folii]MTV82687.1 hypothetical protein [Secundilactobacillus folii]